MSSNLLKKLYLKENGNKIFRTWCWTRELYFRKYTTEPTALKTSNTMNKDLVSSQEDAKEVEVIFSNKRVMKLSTGKLAKFSDGCATATIGNTTVMATVVGHSNPGKPSSLPLTVNYLQKAAALGRIPLNFYRRDMGHSELEILTSRVIDRSIRPLFLPDFNWDVQVVCNPLAEDGNNFPDVLSINAASAALALSDIPWEGPVGAVRVGWVDGMVLTNPSKSELSESILNLIVTSRQNKLIVMLEGFSNGIGIPELLKAVKQGAIECQAVIAAIGNLKKSHGKIKRAYEPVVINPELKEAIELASTNELETIFQDLSHDKLSRDQAVSTLRQKVLAELGTKFGSGDLEMADKIFHSVCKNVFRKQILESGTRCDGRSEEDLRNIFCEVGLYQPLHGSALFQRGQTQVMCTVALGSPASAMKLDKVGMITSGLKEKNFFVHYQFPPYATKEIGKIGPVGRREIGHGALAEKALKAVVPRDFPFTIRVTSEVLESNGSSSMATVCGGSLALLDAGVPLEDSCAGVALGLVSTFAEENPLEIKDYKILTDILGIEDHFGDMDFKLAGTKKNITAIQMDIKNSGISIKVLSEILAQGKSGISQILVKMNSVCGNPRSQKKRNWPSMQKVNVPPHLRSKFLGPGGINIKQLEMKAGVEISEDNPGEFLVFATNDEAMKEATDEIQRILEHSKEPILEFGNVYTAKVVEIREHGCMVTLYSDMTPVLIHVSQLDVRKVSHPSALGITVGQEFKVKYFGRDPVSGTMRLSKKVLQGITTHSPEFVVKKETSEKEKVSDSEKNEK